MSQNPSDADQIAEFLRMGHSVPIVVSGERVQRQGAMVLGPKRQSVDISGNNAMPIFRCCWCQTRSEHPQAGVLVVCPECGIKFNAIDWRAKGKDMSHQFNVGDIVRLNGNTQEAEVIGLKEATGSEGPLLHVQLAGTKIYFPVKSVTLVRSSGEAQAGHPSKLET